MTQEAPEASTSEDVISDLDETRVVRDQTFTRCVTDRGIVLDLGRDMEIAFLQAGPDLMTFKDHGESEGLTLDPVLTEVSRVRISWPSALDLAMNVIREGIGKGAVNVPLVLEAIESYPNPSAKEKTTDAS